MNPGPRSPTWGEAHNQPAHIQRRRSGFVTVLHGLPISWTLSHRRDIGPVTPSPPRTRGPTHHRPRPRHRAGQHPPDTHADAGARTAGTAEARHRGGQAPRRPAAHGSGTSLRSPLRPALYPPPARAFTGRTPAPRPRTPNSAISVRTEASADEASCCGYPGTLVDSAARGVYGPGGDSRARSAHMSQYLNASFRPYPALEARIRGGLRCGFPPLPRVTPSQDPLHRACIRRSDPCWPRQLPFPETEFSEPAQLVRKDGTRLPVCAPGHMEPGELDAGMSTWGSTGDPKVRTPQE
ncbi:hypothetical protein H180DRAFT_00345 [Streptomyces sp. WMMB 322]|nr:hypothetical protein H180DRAFT_00345 [Streptomyces sp. WMMB 322]